MSRAIPALNVVSGVILGFANAPIVKFWADTDVENNNLFDSQCQNCCFLLFVLLFIFIHYPFCARDTKKSYYEK